MCLYLWTTTDAFGRLTKKPQNTLVVGNQNAQLDCSTDVASGAGGNAIEWTYDHDYIVWPPCTSQHPESIIASSPNPATDCNIQALSSAPDGISGAYVCIDKDEKAIAMVIVIGSILRFVIFSNYFLHHQCTVIAEFVGNNNCLRDRLRSANKFPDIFARTNRIQIWRTFVFATRK